MSPSATPAMQSAAASPATDPVQARHQSQPSAISTTPATQNEGGCHQVPRLPRETKVDVTRGHACHVKRRWMSPSATPATQSAAASPATNPVQARHQSQPSVSSATPATQNEGGCHQAPRLPRENEGGCHQAPRLPRKVPRRHRRLIRSKRTTKASPASPVPRLPRKTMSPSATPATQSAAASPATNRVQARHQSQPSVSSATPATQNEGGCHQAPRLPRKTKVDVTKCHACHQVPRLPRETKGEMVCERWWLTKMIDKDGV